MGTNGDQRGRTDRVDSRILGGFIGWLKRAYWSRESRKFSEDDIAELRKRLIIIDRQLDEMPISRRIHTRRMELLTDRERCRTIIGSWETARKR